VRFKVDKVALEQVFLRVLKFSSANHRSTSAPYSSPPHEVCDSPDQAAHCHTFGPKLGGFISDPELGWSRTKSSFLVVSEMKHINGRIVRALWAKKA
jgi:hypothetical protein